MRWVGKHGGREFNTRADALLPVTTVTKNVTLEKPQIMKSSDTMQTLKTTIKLQSTCIPLMNNEIHIQNQVLAYEEIKNMYRVKMFNLRQHQIKRIKKIADVNNNFMSIATTSKCTET